MKIEIYECERNENGEITSITYGPIKHKKEKKEEERTSRKPWEITNYAIDVIEGDEKPGKYL